MNAQIHCLLDQTKGETKALLMRGQEIGKQEIPWQQSKQIIKLNFQISFEAYSFLGQTEGEKKAFLEVAKRGSAA